MPAWIHNYNHHRPNTAIGKVPPISRLTNLTGQYIADVPDTLVSDRNRLSTAVDIVRTHGPLSGSDMAKQMSRCGHPMSERTGLRWRPAPRNTNSSAVSSIHSTSNLRPHADCRGDLLAQGGFGCLREPGHHLVVDRDGLLGPIELA
jgi:hypothetical protein